MRQHTGKVKFSVSDIGEIESNYLLTFLKNGKTRMHFNLKPVFKDAIPIINKWNEERTIFGSLSGSTDSLNSIIKAEKGYISGLKIASSDAHFEQELVIDFHNPICIEYESISATDKVEIRYGLSNLLYWGNEITKRNDTFSRDTIKINIEGKEVKIRHLEKYSEIEKQFRISKDVQITSEMIIEADYSDFNEITKMVKNINMVISFGAVNYVTDLYIDIYKDGKLAKTIFKPLKTYPYINAIPVIDASIHGDKEFATFIETAYPKYAKYKDNLGLDIVFEYYISSRGSNILELSYLLGAVTFECIDSYLPDFFKAQGITKNVNTFREKTRSLCEYFGITFTEDELNFVTIRNSIVHTGRFPNNKNPVDELNSLINLLDRCLLTILDYNGKPYYNIKSQTKEIL